VSIGLSRMSVQLPGRMEPVDDILVRSGRSTTERRMFSRIYGLRQSPVLAAGEGMADLLAAVGREALGGDRASLILYGHTLLAQELGRPEGFASWLRAQLGLPGVPVYGISHLYCTSVLRAVELARGFLQSPRGGAGPVLVLGGDHGSIDDTARLVLRMTVGGDAAVAFTVMASGRGTPARYRYLAGASARDTRFYRNTRMSETEFALFGRVCCEQAVAVVREAAAAAGLDLADVDWLMPHLSNAMFWRTFASMSGFPPDRICLTLLPEQGHNFGADALMALARADADGQLRPGQRCALVALGQGAYMRAVIVEIVEDS
jgi:3-oxoacyl-[acyl-carrier-protein] synthase III